MQTHDKNHTFSPRYKHSTYNKARFAILWYMPKRYRPNDLQPAAIGRFELSKFCQIFPILSLACGCLLLHNVTEIGPSHEKTFFSVAATAILNLKILILVKWLGPYCEFQCSSKYQISSKSVNFKPRYSDITIFILAADSHMLNFWNLPFLSCDRPYLIATWNMHFRSKFDGNR